MANSELKLPSDESNQLMIKSQGISNPDYGIEPEKRSIKQLLEYGTINIDKVSGPTSHEVVSWIKKILEIDSVGHGGTLDPKVTGILPVT